MYRRQALSKNFKAKAHIVPWLADLKPFFYFPFSNTQL
jgi:hypothetical protein